ncbi:DUF6161 domain-containing protein [Ekhidna sp.]|uniref:DUF6161 domain-containing protein n=1 Tax=Ekhidna sp. TaxID=2608089 RepID=UPI003B502B78
MTLTEFKNKVKQAEDLDWWKNKSTVFNLGYIGFEKEITGVTAIYQFVSQQLRGWNGLDGLPPELTNSISYFTNIQNGLISFLGQVSQPTNNLENQWNRQVQNQINAVSNLFPFLYNCPETDFILDVYSIYSQQSVTGAFHFITNRINNSSLVNNRDYFQGFVLGYEFDSRDKSDITSRRKKEQKSFSKLRSDFQDYLTESEAQLSEHLSNATEKYDEYVTTIDDFKSNKEDLFDKWFEKSKGDFHTFDADSKSKISNLEETYQEKLKLEEPAKYWEKRAENLRKQGWWALIGLLILVGGVSFTLQDLLWKVPEQIYESFFEGDKSAAIRWSIIYVTFISFVAFAVKAITKVMFSSFHLARDSEERYTLTYFYLSLLKDSKVDEKDKQLIIQSLFSRADTGLLKDDSAPTMPSDSITKIFK